MKPPSTANTMSPSGIMLPMGFCSSITTACAANGIIAHRQAFRGSMNASTTETMATMGYATVKYMGESHASRRCPNVETYHHVDAPAAAARTVAHNGAKYLVTVKIIALLYSAVSFHLRCRMPRFRYVVSAFVILMAMASAAAAQAPAAGGQRAGGAPPAPMKNLQVLPKDTPQPQVVALMRTLNTALGVQCGYCHEFVAAGNPANDMAADTKPPKAGRRA